jgi:hypothetical protein
LRGRFEPFAGGLLEHCLCFFGSMRRSQRGDDEFLDAGVAIAFEIVGSDRLAGVGDRQFDLGTLAAIGFE